MILNDSWTDAVRSIYKKDKLKSKFFIINQYSAQSLKNRPQEKYITLTFTTQQNRPRAPGDAAIYTAANRRTCNKLHCSRRMTTPLNDTTAPGWRYPL